MRGLQKHISTFSETSHVILTSTNVLKKAVLNGLRRPLNIVLSPEKAEEWHKWPHIPGFPKKFKPFRLDPPPPTSGHGTTAQFPLDLD
jgi:hypothetical protein